MSYILQALKKSEQERQQAIQVESSSPNEQALVEGIAQKKEVEKPNASWVLNAVYGFLLVILAFILLKLFSGGEAQEKQLVSEVSSSTSVTKERKAEVQSEGEPELSRQPASLPQEALAIEQAPSELLADLPVMAISSHIYSTQPERRSIVVNGERLIEGSFIAASVQVKEITHQGMVVDVNGWSLVVSRSRGWGQ